MQNICHFVLVSLLSYRESIMGARAERSSPEWVCIPEITSDGEWFLWNTNSWGWSPFCTVVHNRLYFFHNVFSCDSFTKTWDITLKSSEITVRDRKSQLSVEEKLISHMSHGLCVFSGDRLCGHQWLRGSCQEAQRGETDVPSFWWICQSKVRRETNQKLQFQLTELDVSTHFFACPNSSTQKSNEWLEKNEVWDSVSVSISFLPSATIGADGYFHRSLCPSVGLCPSVSSEWRYRCNSLRISAISLKFGGMMYSTMEQIAI